MAHHGACSNWLSKIIDEQRWKVGRVHTLHERAVQCEAIVSAIKSHLTGTTLVDQSKLTEAVLMALDLADELECEAEQNSAAKVAPAIEASWLVFEKLRWTHLETEV
jgi:hypothetical protein